MCLQLCRGDERVVRSIHGANGECMKCRPHGRHSQGPRWLTLACYVRYACPAAMGPIPQTLAAHGTPGVAWALCGPSAPL